MFCVVWVVVCRHTQFIRSQNALGVLVIHLFIFNLYGCFASMYVCEPQVYYACRTQKRILDPWSLVNLELQTVMNHHMGAWNPAWVL